MNSLNRGNLKETAKMVSFHISCLLETFGVTIIPISDCLLQTILLFFDFVRILPRPYTDYSHIFQIRPYFCAEFIQTILHFFDFVRIPIQTILTVHDFVRILTSNHYGRFLVFPISSVSFPDPIQTIFFFSRFVRIFYIIQRDLYNPI